MSWLPGDALVVNMAGLLGEEPGATRDLAFDGLGPGLDLGEGLVQDAPLVARFHVARTNRGLVVTGSVETSLADTCARCLKSISVPVAGDVAEEVLPLLDLVTGARLDLAAEPEVMRLSDHHELDLERLAREAIVLAAPIAPVCRPDCPGLCPTCGEELGPGHAEHLDEPIDPRLEALLQFRDPDGGGSAG